MLEVTKKLQAAGLGASVSAREVADMLEQHLQTDLADFTAQAQSPRWFIDLSDDWGIRYYADGSVAQDPQME